MTQWQRNFLVGSLSVVGLWVALDSVLAMLAAEGLSGGRGDFQAEWNSLV